MRVEDFDGTCHIDRDDELVARLRSVRRGSFGAFILSHAADGAVSLGASQRSRRLHSLLPAWRQEPCGVPAVRRPLYIYIPGRGGPIPSGRWERGGRLLHGAGVPRTSRCRLRCGARVLARFRPAGLDSVARVVIGHCGAADDTANTVRRVSRKRCSIVGAKSRARDDGELWKGRSRSETCH